MTDHEPTNSLSKSGQGGPPNHFCVSGGGGPGENNRSQKETTRRRFLQIGTGIFSSLVALILGIPMIGTVIDHMFKKKPVYWSKIGAISRLSDNQPTNLSFPYQTQDAYLRETVTHSAWVIKHSAADITVFSPICPHLGCHYDWHPEKNEFICPCHGSIYSIAGKVLGGPAPRPLDTLPWKLEGGELWVQWEMFRVGIPKKVRV
jgi:menaquinol-cytochrome c reductase iron-sulfur subunit